MTSLPTLKQVFDNPDVAAALIFCAAAAVGQAMHAVKKWADGTTDCLFGWFRSNLRRTVGAAIGNVGGMLVFIQTGVLGPLLALPNGWWAIVLFGFMNGFSTDSALNSATRKAWSDEERAAKTLPADPH